MNTRIVLLSPAIDLPSPSFFVDDVGQIIDRGLLTDNASPVIKARTVLIVPGTGVVTRWLETESVSDAGSTAVLLKDEIGAPRDSVHLVCGAADDDGWLPICIIDRLLMQEFLDRAAALGVKPDVVVPDHLALPAPGEGVLAVTINGVVAVRGQRLAFSAEEELAAMLIGDRLRTSVEGASEIERLLCAPAGQVAINLLQHDFAAAGHGRGSWHGYRRAAALAAVAVLSPLAIWAAEIARNEISARDFENRAESRTLSLIPDNGSADPVRELRGRLAELRGNDAFMRSTAALFEAMSQIPGIELDRFSYLQEGVIRATLIHGAAADVNALKQALESEGMTLDPDASEEEDGRMTTAIVLRWRP